MINKEKQIRWVYLVVGVVLLLFLGLIYAWPVFRVPLEQEFGWTKAQTSITFSISMTMFCLGGLISGILAKRKPPRIALYICAAFLVIGFIAASKATTLVQIYISYGVFCGLGVGFGYNTTISTVVKWFPDKQGLISGLALMGFGCGSMFLGTIAAGMITNIGWRMTFVAFGIAFAIIVIIGSFLLKPAPENLVAALNVSKKKQIESVEEIGFSEMLKRRNFWIYFAWAIVLSAAGLAIINISTLYAGEFVGNLTQAAAIAGVVSIANGVGRVAFGQLFDSKGFRVTMCSVCIMYIIAAAVLIASFYAGSIAILVIAFILIGLAYGGVTPTNSAFTAHFFGRKNYALNFSIVNLNLIVASYLGPMCGNGTYTNTFICIIVFAIIGAVLTLLVKRDK